MNYKGRFLFVNMAFPISFPILHIGPVSSG